MTWEGWLGMTLVALASAVIGWLYLRSERMRLRAEAAEAIVDLAEAKAATVGVLATADGQSQHAIIAEQRLEKARAKAATKQAEARGWSPTEAAEWLRRRGFGVLLALALTAPSMVRAEPPVEAPGVTVLEHDGEIGLWFPEASWRRIVADQLRLDDLEDELDALTRAHEARVLEVGTLREAVRLRGLEVEAAIEAAQKERARRVAAEADRDGLLDPWALLGIGAGIGSVVTAIAWGLVAAL